MAKKKKIDSKTDSKTDLKSQAVPVSDELVEDALHSNTTITSDEEFSDETVSQESKEHTSKEHVSKEHKKKESKKSLILVYLDIPCFAHSPCDIHIDHFPKTANSIPMKYMATTVTSNIRVAALNCVAIPPIRSHIPIVRRIAPSIMCGRLHVHFPFPFAILSTSMNNWLRLLKYAHCNWYNISKSVIYELFFGKAMNSKRHAQKTAGCRGHFTLQHVAPGQNSGLLFQGLQTSFSSGSLLT